MPDASPEDERDVAGHGRPRYDVRNHQPPAETHDYRVVPSVTCEASGETGEQRLTEECDPAELGALLSAPSEPVGGSALSRRRSSRARTVGTAARREGAGSGGRGSRPERCGACVLPTSISSASEARGTPEARAEVIEGELDVRGPEVDRPQATAVPAQIARVRAERNSLPAKHEPIPLDERQ